MINKNITIEPHIIIENNKIIIGHFKIKEWGFIFSSKEDAEEYANTHTEKNGLIIKL